MTKTAFTRLHSRIGPLGWAAFLACSWTWCIGMYLPVILIGKFGLPGWFVFAAPNVVGAAAMGWVLSRPGASEELVARHSTACAWFSVITILFHIYFTGWIIACLIGTPVAMSALVLAMIFWAFGRLKSRRDLRLATVILAWSIIAFAAFSAIQGWPSIDLSSAPAGARNPLGEGGVVWLMPVCVFGFALCPYLDLTFHRARQAVTVDGAKIAFGVGFGLFFLLMILFTLWYAPFLIKVVNQSAPSRPPSLLAWIVGAHLVIQSAFTISMHLRSLTPGDLRISMRGAVIGILGLIWAMTLAGMVTWLTQSAFTPRFGEMGYLVLLSFYGLVFPAYVWLCMVPDRTGVAHASARLIRASMIAIVLAAPLYWIGFIGGRTLWLLPAVLFVLAMKWLIRKESIFSPRPDTSAQVE